MAFANIVENNPAIINQYAAEKGISLANMIDAQGNPTPEVGKMQSQIIEDIKNLSNLQQMIVGSNAQSVDIVHVLGGKA